MTNKLLEFSNDQTTEPRLNKVVSEKNSAGK
jgi:hypothetical protein